MTTTNNDSGLNLDHLEALRKIGSLITTQDNRITDQPMFIVQQRRRMYGLDLGCCDDFIWLCSEDEYSEASAEEAAALEAEYQDTGRAKNGWQRTGYADQWEFVTACFTEQGCIDYLKLDGHNLKEPRIYAEGSYRNDEFRIVRNALIALAGRAAQPVAAPTAGDALHEDVVSGAKKLIHVFDVLPKNDDELRWARIAAPLHALRLAMVEVERAALANQPAPTVPATLPDAAALMYNALNDVWQGGILVGEDEKNARAALLEYNRHCSGGAHQPAQEQASPAHETIVSEAGTLVCTACGTTAQEQAEPVAWMDPSAGCVMDAFLWQKDRSNPQYSVPVYTPAPQAPVAAAPDARSDWQWVPVEPTEAMVHAAEDLSAPRMFGKVYRATIGAAPTHAAQHKSNTPEFEGIKTAGAQQAHAGADEAPSWKPVAGPGQVDVGARLRFTIGDKQFHERAKLILNAGTDKEEVIYDRGRNFYFITAMVLSGFSNHKGVEFLPPKRAAIQAAQGEKA